MPRLLVALALVVAASPASLVASQADVPILARYAVVGTHTEGIVVATTDGVATRTGRAEVLFADGTLLHVDADSSLRWAVAGPLSLDNGRVLLRTGTAGWLDVVLPFARVTLAPGGAYGLLMDAAHARLLVTVMTGGADVQTSAAKATLGPSELVVLTEQTSRIVATAFEPAPWDTFLLWSRARLSARVLAVRQSDPLAAGGTVISLGPGGFHEPGPVGEPASSYSGGEVIWYGGSGIVGWPVWGYGGGRDWWDKRRDPYAPHYEPHYEPYPYGGARGPRGEGRGGPGKTGPVTRAPTPRELPPAIPPPPAQAPPPARGGVGKLPSPGVPPSGARPPG